MQRKKEAGEVDATLSRIVPIKTEAEKSLSQGDKAEENEQIPGYILALSYILKSLLALRQNVDCPHQR